MNFTGVFHLYEKNAKMTYSKETIEEVLKYPFIRVPDHVPLEAAEHFEIRSAVNQTDGKTVEATYFPYYDQQNKLVGFKKRDWTKAKNEKFHFTTVGKVEATCKMFGQHKASANPKKIAVVEGETDMAVAWYTIQQHLKGLDKKYHPSFAIVSLPAGCGNAQASASANAKFLLSGQELILGLDSDERLPGEKKNVVRGKEGKEAMFSALLSNKIKELTWPVGHKDARDYATECLQQKKLKDFFDLVMYSPTNYNGSGVVKPDDIGYEEFIKPIPLGVMISSLPKTMEKLMGIRKRELTMITGPSGCGKSTITAEVLHYLASEGYRTGIIFLEEIARKTLQRLAARYLEINYKDFKFDPSKAASEEDLKRAWDWISDEEADRFSLVNHFGSLLVDELMNKIKYMVHVEKRDYVLLDHINMLTAGSGSTDERRELDTIMEKLSAFVASNDFGLICVAHINREASKVRPPAGKEDQPYWVKVKATDLRGTAGLEQMSWNIIGLESEWLPDRTRGRIRTVVLKNREASELGEGDVLMMNPATGLLEDAADKNEAEF